MTDEIEIDLLINDLLTGKVNARQRATDKLIQIGEPSIEPLLKAIQKDDHNETMEMYECYFLREILIKIGEPAFDRLIEALKERQSHIIGGRAAVKTLVRFNDVRVVEPLVAVILDKHYGLNTRCYAIDALGYFKAPSAFDSIIAALQDEEILIVGHAAVALGEYRDKRALGPLNEVLSRSDRSSWMDWKEAVLEAIKAIGNPDYRPLNRGFFINNYYHYNK